MKRKIPYLLLLLCLILVKASYAQKSASSPTNLKSSQGSAVGCTLVVSIQDNNPTSVCSELLKTLVAVTGSCTDTTAVSYKWSSSIGGVFSTARVTSFNLPEFLVATPVTFTVWVKDGSDSLSANYTLTIKPRPSRPTLSPFGTITLCDNAPITLTSSACSTGSTTVWSNGATGVSSISVPAIGGTYFKVACEKNGCVSDSTAAAALITGIPTAQPITTGKTICEGTSISSGNGLQAQLVNCSSTATGTYTYGGGMVGYDQGYISTGSVDPSITVPSGLGSVANVRVSITWRKQKGGFQNSCGVGDTESWPYHSETRFRVKSPSGRIITLINTGTYGGQENPTVTTVFQDGATPVNFYSPPVSGTFASAEPLSGFIGEAASGRWTLLPYDAVWKDPLCVSGFALTFTSATQNGTITWWDAPTGGNLLGTGNEYIPTVTNPGTYTYYAQGQCNLGCPSVRTPTTFTINATPVAPSVSVNVPLVNGVRTICTGESITLTATGCSNGTVQWNSNYDGTAFATGSSYTFTPNGSTNSNLSYSLSAQCKSSNLCLSTQSNELNILVKYKPAIPVISGSGSSLCVNSAVSLLASGCTGGVVGWTGNRTGASLNFSLSSSVSIRAACTINGCTSDSSAVYTITALPRPNVLTVNASQVQSLCYGTSVTLSASACSGTVKWTGGLSGSPITITPLSTRSYKAACLGTNGCVSDSSVALTVIVLPKTKPVITGSSLVCGTTSVTLTATGCSGVNETVMWRDESIGVTLTETVSQTKTYRAVCIRNGYCVSDSSDIFTVRYGTKPATPSIVPPSNPIVCQGNTVVLTSSACTGGALGWTGGLTGNSINITSVGTRSYKVACTINGCTSDSSLAVSVTVNAKPNISIVASKTSICVGDTATLTLQGCLGSIMWSNGATNSFIKVSPTVVTNYSATCTTSNGCVSTAQQTVAILSTPFITSSGILTCGQEIILTAQSLPSGASIQWRKNGINIYGATTSTLTVSSPGTYDFVHGSSWSTQSITAYNTSIPNNRTKIQFINMGIGYYLINSIIKKTLDGGVTWTDVYTGSNIKDFYFIDATTGWAIGNEKIIKTTNGGGSWLTYTGNLIGLTLEKVTFKDSNTGVAFTADSKSIYTVNGGNTWVLNTGTIVNPVPTTPLYSIQFIPNTNKVVIIGVADDFSGIYKTSVDNGASWSPQTLPNNNSGVFDIQFMDANTGWMLGRGTPSNLYTTSDGGATWTYKSVFNVFFDKLNFVNTQVGYITSNYDKTIYKTINGGTSWINYYIGETNRNFLQINFATEDNGWLLSRDNASNTYLQRVSIQQCATIPSVVAPPSRPNAPTITQPINPTICQGNTFTLTAIGCSGGTYYWTDRYNGSSIVVNPNTTRSYKVACTINGCTSDSSVAVSVTVKVKPATPTISSTGNTVCQGNTIVLTSSACTGGALGWTGGLTGNSINITSVGTRSYKVACTVNGCTSDSSLAVSVTVNAKPATPTISTTGTTTICQGNTIVLTSSACTGGALGWTGGLTGNSINITSVGTRSYKVACTINGCTSDSSVAVSVTVNAKPTSPVISQGNTITICSGQNMALSVIPVSGASYGWTDRATGTSTSITPLTSRVYRVATTINGCVSDSTSIVINVTSVPAPIISLGGQECTNILPSKVWDKLIPFSNSNYLGNVKASVTTSDNGLFSVIEEGGGVKIVKLDYLGVVQWSRTLSYANNPNRTPQINAAVETADGGFLLGGKIASDTPSGDANFTSYPSITGMITEDFWVIKINATGTTEWSKHFGGDNEDELFKIEKTSDGGFVLGGTTNSDISNDVEGRTPLKGYWLVKIDAFGNKVWTRRQPFPSYLSRAVATLNGLEIADDGGVILGESNYTPYDYIYSYHVVKLNSLGVFQWENFYTLSGNDVTLVDIEKTTDNGFILAGYRENSNKNIWLVKISENGTKLWDKLLGGGNYEQLQSIKVIPSENNILLGVKSANGIGFDKTEASRGSSDMWLLKLRPDGTKIWDKTIGAFANDNISTLNINANNDIILGGYSADSPIAGERSVAGSGLWYVKLKSICTQEPSINIALGDSLTLSANACSGIVNWSNGRVGPSIIVKPIVNVSYAATCSTTCISPMSTPFVVNVLQNATCETLKSGAWNDPTTWSCNRVPTINYHVIINAEHVVTTPTNSIIYGKSLTYRGGILELLDSTSLILGQ